MNVVLVSGGSGGHLVPALALAGRLREEGRCVLVSTRRPVDRILSAAAPEQGPEWVTVEMEGFRPLRRWLSPAFAGRQLRAVRRVHEVISRVRPDAVVGFGGYLSAVGIVAARQAGIPSVIHEQNLLPGSSNRWLARFADAVAISFPETARHFRGHPRVEVTGNPIRLAPGRRDPVAAGAGGGATTPFGAAARRHFGFDAERPVLLVMGGSQGSRTINSLVLGMWEERSPEERRSVQLLHLAGPAAEQVEAAYHRLGMDHRVYPFLHEMELALSAATLAVSRAGATGITEMAAFGLPALLIPYPYAKRHQLANARWMERAGGAVVLEESGLTPRRLWESVSALLHDASRLEKMRRALHSQGPGAGPAEGDAAERLAGLVRRTAGLPGTRSARAELVEARTPADTWR